MKHSTLFSLASLFLISTHTWAITSEGGSPDLTNTVKTAQQCMNALQTAGTIQNNCALTAPPATQDEFGKRWDAYVATTAGFDLQPNCKPRRFSPPAGVPTKGTVVLYHGFTACPQQYFELANQLTQQGYEVLLPLLPGHGRNPTTPPFGDDITRLPDMKHWREYQDLADQMNHVMEAARGQKVVGGLSVGGSIAMYATASAPNLYDRQLIMSPLLDLSNKEASTALTLRKFLPVGWVRSGWGEGCHQEKTQGRAGICDFEINNVAATQAMGLDALSKAKPMRTQSQIIAVEDDPTAKVSTIKDAYQRYGVSPNNTLCFMPKTVNHSLLSRFDSPQENKWWIGGLESRVVDYIVNGKPAPQAGESVEGSEYHQCDVGCPADKAEEYGCSR